MDLRVCRGVRLFCYYSGHAGLADPNPLRGISMSPSIPASASMALGLIAEMAAHKFGASPFIPKFDCVATTDDLSGARAPKVKSKTYRPRSARKRGGRR